MFFIEEAFVADTATEARHIAVKIAEGNSIVHRPLYRFLDAELVALDILADTLVEGLVAWKEAYSIVVVEATV